jgi:hypothetical protein
MKKNLFRLLFAFFSIDRQGHRRVRHHRVTFSGFVVCLSLLRWSDIKKSAENLEFSNILPIFAAETVMLNPKNGIAYGLR